ncbi:MAG: pro-sigmaK processing inhibitor BofA family protein [Clostridium sp.]|uniref:pro-sigmaK processing inhibitor BofA family protein n=1 Tax=Clostridium culturomicium TaxID=1499683 RepID=UPI00058FD821|nr:pro-sigmaK processing inhibitor BofA family protein [Clostridium culturomicium]MDU4892805.1 pro-sigmaK processing inhibitor BofA family protein [Clostridium sp.]MDU7085994.1 pro-sigmaK processing inhibitor BofA family protein [Clostridium sp.]
MSNIVYFIIAVLAIFIVGKIFAWPFKILLNLIINGIMGGVLLFLINLVGSKFGLIIPINAITALIAGFLGIPGVLFLVIVNYLR